MKKTILCCLICLAIFKTIAFSQSVDIRQPDNSPETEYAVKMLKKALLGQKYAFDKTPADYDINLAINSGTAVEAFSLKSEKGKIAITGGDGRGLIYGCLSLAEDLRNGISLQKIKARSESPKLPFRAIKFNLPWDTYRHSYALDLHQETSRDLHFWEEFLDMMAENRFNALTLWNLHPFTFMIRPKNFPKASPLNDQELKEWQTFYKGVFRMARERGIDTYIVNWNIFVSPEFAKAHNVAMDNLDHKIHATGILQKLLNAIPGSRSRRCWKNIRICRELALPTAKACGE